VNLATTRVPSGLEKRKEKKNKSARARECLKPPACGSPRKRGKTACGLSGNSPKMTGRAAADPAQLENQAKPNSQKTGHGGKAFAFGTAKGSYGLRPIWGLAPSPQEGRQGPLAT